MAKMRPTRIGTQGKQKKLRSEKQHIQIRKAPCIGGGFTLKTLMKCGFTLSQASASLWRISSFALSPVGKPQKTLNVFPAIIDSLSNH